MAVALTELMEKQDRLALQLLSGEAGLGRKILHPQVEIFSAEPEFWKQIEKGTVLIVGREGLSDLGCLDLDEAIYDRIRDKDIACFVFSEVNFLPRHLVQFSEANRIPLFTSKFDPYLLRSRILGILREKIEALASIQGVFIRVFGVGLIIKGESGLGKTECALELVTRGHQIIADDLIELHKTGKGAIFGQSPEISRNLLYIKGLGIINVKELYGRKAVLERARVDGIVEFVEWSRDVNIMGQEREFLTMMDINIPLIRIPVRPNQMTTIMEVVAKKFLLEEGGSEGQGRKKPERSRRKK